MQGMRIFILEKLFSMHLSNAVWTIGIYNKIEKKILSGIALNYYFLENTPDNTTKNIY